MPEEATPEAPEETQETPQEEAAPDTGTPAPEQQVNYEQRYNDLRPEFDRATQEREEARQEALALRILRSPDEYDDDQVRLAAEIVGEEPPTQEDDETEDPYLTREEFQQAETQRQEQETLQQVDAHIGQLAEGAEIELTGREQRALLADAIEGDISPEVTEKVFKEFQKEREALRKSVIDGYVKGKKNTPHVSSVGGPMTTEDVLPPDASRADRQRWMTERYQTNQQ